MDPLLQKMAKREWYTQGFASRPLLLLTVPSIDIMQRDAGFSYDALVADFKNDYCEFDYGQDDLITHGQHILNQLQKNPKYLHEQRALYDESMPQFEKGFHTLRKDLSTMSLEELVKWLNWGAHALESAAGRAHMIESLSFMLENQLRQRLQTVEEGKQLNEDFATLASPVNPSFLSQRDDALAEIKEANPKIKQKLVEKFANDFYWSNASYVGDKPWTISSILRASEELVVSHKVEKKELLAKKEKLFQKYHFTQKEIALVRLAELSIDWQDDRKKNILKCISAIDAVLHEIAKREKMDVKLLHYMLPHEITLQSLKKGNISAIAEERIKGSIYVKQLGSCRVFVGKDYKEYHQTKHKHEEMELIMGNAASLGFAAGPVKICTTLESLEKVKKGDILVASMTRPEYVNAMKKAAAIVTDEGGVTCHAAIVSRELGIPCVIGTKIATKVLKDGWIVHVKANHGMVRVIQKKSLAVSHPQTQQSN